MHLFLASKQHLLPDDVFIPESLVHREEVSSQVMHLAPEEPKSAHRHVTHRLASVRKNRPSISLKYFPGRVLSCLKTKKSTVRNPDSAGKSG